MPFLNHCESLHVLSLQKQPDHLCVTFRAFRCASAISRICFRNVRDFAYYCELPEPV